MFSFLVNNFSQKGVCFPSPAPDNEQKRIFPLFIPFVGCGNRCVFCAQHLQTGQRESSIPRLLHEADEALTTMREKGAAPLELAFYGGTFTALSPHDLAACLAFGERWLRTGFITAVRCSTRPDALGLPVLASLAEHGVTTIELGIQSFSSPALALAQRGYTGQTAREGCAAVLSAGFRLGIQLMPGMPGVTPAIAAADLHDSLDATPDFLRLYPCLVFKGTPLARLWEDGSFTPWNLGQTVEFLAQACRAAWQRQVPIIRMGVAQEQGMLPHILSGPYHPALGNMAKSLALALVVQEHWLQQTSRDNTGGEQHKGVVPGHPLPDHGIFTLPTPWAPPPATANSHTASHPANAAISTPVPPLPSADALPPTYIYAPRRAQGEFWGYQGSLSPFYARMGITPASTVFWHHPFFFLAQEPLPPGIVGMP